MRDLSFDGQEQAPPSSTTGRHFVEKCISGGDVEISRVCRSIGGLIGCDAWALGG